MIASYKDYLYYLGEDRKALNIRVCSTFSLSYFKNLFYPDKIWQFEKSLRKNEYLSNTPGGGIIRQLRLILIKTKFRKLSLQLGFSIPINTFGPGLSIAHYGSIVVSGNARIGRNCRIHSATNIGASSGKSEAPAIGDNVYIGPGAILFGNIRITNNVTIGANATVNKDCLVEGGCYAGTPAKLIKDRQPLWWKNNRLDLS